MNMKLITMEAMRVFSVLLLLSASSVFCFPSRPLNERSKELTWQAWLLVDDQNQSKQNEPEAYMRRRITPKSVFIAPTFSPDKLPACAEGYQSDAMGRCIQIFKIDQAAHLEFLLQKLNEKFGNFDEYEESQENLPTPGPFQLNIPLDEIAETDENYDNNPDIAIVVAPTNGNFDMKGADGVKVNVKRTDQSNVMDNFKVDETAATTTDSSEDETTTLEVTTEVESTTTFETTTSVEEITETTTLEVTTESTTTVLPETTTEFMQALFFLDPPQQKRVNSTIDFRDTLLADGSDVVVLGNRMKINSENAETSQPESTTKRIVFEDAVLVDAPSSHDLIASNAKHTANFVRFPSSSEEHSYQRLPHPTSHIKFHHEEQTNEPSTQREFESLFQDYIKTRGADLSSNERHIFRNRQPPEEEEEHHANFRREPLAHLKLPSSSERLSATSTSHGSTGLVNHRNRDKHLWNLPSNWRESSPHKPIVLKFSGRPGGSGRHSENLYQHRQNSEGIYREVPPEDLSYIFGFKRRPRTLR